MSDRPGATVLEAAANLSNLRNRLSAASSQATLAVGGVTPRAETAVKAVRDLVREVDDVYDDLRPYAYLVEAPLIRLLAVSVAMERVEQGDTEGALAALVDAAGRPGLQAVAS